MTEPAFAASGVIVHLGDCLDVMRTIPDASIDAVITDPPYGLSATDPAHVVEALTKWLAGDRAYTPKVGSGFMGKEWDEFVPPPAAWDEAFRVLKPGGHLLSFAGTRTVDLMALSIRLAQFEIRDSIAWLYGSGMPNSMDVSKAIDKAAGVERTEYAGVKPGHESFVGRDNIANKRTGGGALSGPGGYDRPWMYDPEKVEATHHLMAPATDDARTWEGWATKLKPGFEPIVVARKPLIGTVVENVLTHGVGALHIDAIRVPFASEEDRLESVGKNQHADFGSNRGGTNVYGDFSKTEVKNYDGSKGRWPTNVVLEESQAIELDAQAPSGLAGASPALRSGRGYGSTSQGTIGDRVESPGGGASRIFPTFRYEAKAGADERPAVDGVEHPTVKPLALMQWLVRMVVPPEGVVLDPFAGSGTTVEACIREGVSVVAIEREETYIPLILQRVEKDHQQSLFGDWDGVAS